MPHPTDLDNYEGPILQAFAHSESRWRTSQGIAEALELPASVVEQCIRTHLDKFQEAKVGGVSLYALNDIAA